MDISIIIPVYNVERYLKDCLDSINATAEARVKGLVGLRDCVQDRKSVV